MKMGMPSGLGFMFVFVLAVLLAKIAVSETIVTPSMESVVNWKVERDRTIEAYWIDVAYKYQIKTFSIPRECQPITKKGSVIHWLTRRLTHSFHR